MTPRRYDDREVRAILALATRVEEEESAALALGAEGMTLEQLRSIAIEAGIDLDDLSRAVSRLDTVGLADVEEDVFTATVDVELSEDGVAEVLDAARRFGGRQGQLVERAGAQAWMSSQPSGVRYITVTPRRGATRLEVEHNLVRGKLLHGMVSGLAGFFGGAITAASVGLVDLPALALIAGVAALTASGGLQLWWKPKARREAERLESIFRRLREELRIAASREDLPPQADSDS